MSSNNWVAALIWWSLKRAIRLYNPIRIAVLPLFLALFWFIFSIVGRHSKGINEIPVLWGVAIMVVAAAVYAFWHIAADKSQGFEQSIIWAVGPKGVPINLCTLAAYAVVAAVQCAVFYLALHFMPFK